MKRVSLVFTLAIAAAFSTQAATAQTLKTVSQGIDGRGRPLNVRRLVVAVHHIATEGPGQGVDARLLRLVSNNPRRDPVLPTRGGRGKKSNG